MVEATEAKSNRRVSIIVLSHNRRAQLLATLECLARLPGGWPIIVVDNASTDETASAVAALFPSLVLIRARRDLGAAGRNLGVAFARTPYVAFCNDDVRWEPGALEQATRILDSAPTVGVLSAHVQVGATRRPEPACLAMAQSPLEQGDLPGPRLLGFMGGACVMRTQAFHDVGGYWPPLFIGGEEALLALDLAERGWGIIYAEDVVSRQFPSSTRDAATPTSLFIRNAIWTAWMRRPLGPAWRQTMAQLVKARAQGLFLQTLGSVSVGMPRVLAHRRVVSRGVEAMQRKLEQRTA